MTARPGLGPVLVDTGPLVAWLDKGDQDHEHCRAFFATQPGPFLSTWPVVTEVCHLIPAAAVDRFLQWLHIGGMHLVDLPPEAIGELAELVRRYDNLPMDLADASLLWLAQRRNLLHIATLDRRDFGIYRLPAGQALINLL